MKYKISSILPHPNADSLEILTVSGYQIVSRIGTFKIHEEVYLIEAGQAFRVEEAKKLKLDYLKLRICFTGEKVAVVDTVKLRGVLSEALILPLSTTPDYFKFIPPVKVTQANQKPEVEGFNKFGSLDNIQKRSNSVDFTGSVCREKIYGTNSRIGYTEEGVHFGSRTTVRESGIYSFPYDNIPGIKSFFDHMRTAGLKSCTIYGEIYGRKVQGDKYKYGKDGDSLGYAAFEIRYEGFRVSDLVFEYMCILFDIPTVPRMPSVLSMEELKNIAEGKSSLDGLTDREGVVVTLADGTKMKYVCPSFRLRHVGKEVVDE